MSGDGLPCDAVELVKKLVDKAVGRLDLVSHDKGGVMQRRLYRRLALTLLPVVSPCPASDRDHQNGHPDCRCFLIQMVALHACSSGGNSDTRSGLNAPAVTGISSLLLLLQAPRK